MPEAPLGDVGSGLAPAGDGWFVVNVRDAEWWTSENGARQPSESKCNFESQKFEFAAVAALFAGGANAMVPDDGGGAPAVTTVQPGTIPYLSHGIGVDESQFSGQPSVGLTGDSTRKVDRAVAAANEAYDTYRDKTAIVARQALFTDQQPSVGLTGDSTLTRSSASQPAGLTGDSALTRYPGTVTLSTASSASDGVDGSSFGLGAGMTALLAAGIAGVVLTSRRRGGIALP